MGASPQSAITEFKKEVYKPRCAKALISVTLHHLLAYMVAVVPLAALNTSIVSIPHHWWSVLHPTSWIYLGLIVGLTCAMGFTHAAWYSMKPATYNSKLNQFSKITNYQVLGTVASQLIISAMLTRSYLGLFGSEYLANLFGKCYGSQNFKCINEWHLFLVCQAGVSSIFSSVSYFLGDKNLVTFPVIQLPLKERIRNSMGSNLQQAFQDNLHSLKWFYLFYFLNGGWICSFFTNNLDVSRHGIPVDSILGLLNIPLFVNAVFLGTLSRYVFLMGLSTFEIFQTETYPMEVASMIEANKPLVLTAALDASDLPLLQCLAFHELAALGRKSAGERSPVFSLSQPGGHPHTWNQIVTSSLSQITGLTQKLDSAISPASSDNNNEKKTCADTKYSFHGLRDLTAGFGPKTPPQETKTSQLLNPDWSGMLKKLHQWAEQKPLLSQILKEPADAKCLAALATSCCTAPAVSGIAALTVASYTEDKYGVAQHHLPQLLSSLIQLSTVLEQARRLSVTNSTKPGHILQQAAVLRQTVTTALFQLTAKFGPHLHAICLSPEVIKKLESYCSYAEG